LQIPNRRDAGDDRDRTDTHKASHTAAALEEGTGRGLAAARSGSPRAPEQTTRVRIARDELRRIRDLTKTIDELQRELAILVAKVAPRLLAERGCGVLIAAKLSRRDRRRDPLRNRREARTDRRISTNPRVIRTLDPSPPRPGRQPSAQLRSAPPRDHQGPP